MKTLNLNDDAVNADIRPPVTDDRRIIIGVEDGWIKVDKEVWREYQQLKEKERSIKLECFYETTETYDK